LRGVSDCTKVLESLCKLGDGWSTVVTFDMNIFLKKWRPIGLIFVASGLFTCILLTILYLYRDKFVLSGVTDIKMERKALFLSAIPLPILVDSYGGSASHAMNVSKIIYSRQKSIFITGECSSSCAEFILPAARKVYASEGALIGFHRDDLMAMDFFRSDQERHAYCGADRAAWMVDLYKRQNLNVSFYKNVELKLDIKPSYNVKGSYDNGCVKMFSSSAHEMWYPTSYQLKEMLGIDIGHPICADSDICWKRKLAEGSVRGMSYIVGDKVYYPLGE